MAIYNLSISKMGATVKQGDLLFVIDPRPYQAERERAKAEVALAMRGSSV